MLKRIAVWQADMTGLRWIDELVNSGAAIAARENGYPSAAACAPEEWLLIEAWDES
jgi:hypothetical protein